MEQKASIDAVRKLVFVSKTEIEIRVFIHNVVIWMLPQILTLPEKLNIKQQ